MEIKREQKDISSISYPKIFVKYIFKESTDDFIDPLHIRGSAGWKLETHTNRLYGDFIYINYKLTDEIKENLIETMNKQIQGISFGTFLIDTVLSKDIEDELKLRINNVGFVSIIFGSKYAVLDKSGQIIYYRKGIWYYWLRIKQWLATKMLSIVFKFIGDAR